MKIEKLEAMNKYKKSQFLSNIALYSFEALTCSIFCSSPYWFPSLCTSIKVFLFVSLPNIGSFFFNPMCLFIVGNIIVVFLFGESKLGGSYSSPSSDIYDEYVKSSRRGLPRHSSLEEKEIKWDNPSIEECVKRVEEHGEEEGGGEGKIVKVRKKEVEEDLDGEEELGLPAEELKVRVEGGLKLHY